MVLKKFIQSVKTTYKSSIPTQYDPIKSSKAIVFRPTILTIEIVWLLTSACQSSHGIPNTTGHIKTQIYKKPTTEKKTFTGRLAFIVINHKGPVTPSDVTNYPMPSEKNLICKTWKDSILETSITQHATALRKRIRSAFPKLNPIKLVARREREENSPFWKKKKK